MSVNRSKADNRSVAVANRFRRAIARGEYPRGSRLPPEPELAQKAGVSRATLREALQVLEREGLITRRQRAGTIVSSRPIVHNSLERNFSVRETIEASGKAYGVRDAQIRFVEASSVIAETLQLSSGAPLTVLERVRTADGQPVIFTVDHIQSAIVERATAPLLPEISFYEWMQEHCGLTVTHAIARIEAISAPEELAARLETNPGAPLFKLSQVDYTGDGLPVLYSEEFHLADAFEVTVVRTGPYV
jgi:GntR family transcriptional regulator